MLKQAVLTIETGYTSDPQHAKIRHISLDQSDVSALGNSIPQILESMQQQGWSLTFGRVSPNKEGVIVAYFYTKFEAM